MDWLFDEKPPAYRLAPHIAVAFYDAVAWLRGTKPSSRSRRKPDWKCDRTGADGRSRTVGVDTLALVLRALGLPADSRPEIKESRARLSAKNQALEPLIRAGGRYCAFVEGHGRRTRSCKRRTQDVAVARNG